MKDDYVRSVEIVDVHDGDTLNVQISLGFWVFARMSCRLVGLNTPELSEPGGTLVRDALKAKLEGKLVTIQSVSTDKYAGRFDAIMTTTDLKGKYPLNINLWLINSGMAAPWNGVGIKPKVPWPPVPPEVPLTTLPK
jgi:endonuclease YncB( thermonuclease family)